MYIDKDSNLKESKQGDVISPMMARRIIWHKIKVGFVLVFLVYVLFTYVQKTYDIISLRYEIKQIEAEIAVYKDKNETLVQELARLMGDEYVEKVAREKLGLIKEGEILIILSNN